MQKLCDGKETDKGAKRVNVNFKLLVNFVNSIYLFLNKSFLLGHGIIFYFTIKTIRKPLSRNEKTDMQYKNDSEIVWEKCLKIYIFKFQNYIWFWISKYKQHFLKSLEILKKLFLCFVRHYIIFLYRNFFRVYVSFSWISYSLILIVMYCF